MVARSSSVPPNPFWSERVRDDHALVVMRPEELPAVPVDGETSGGSVDTLGQSRSNPPRAIQLQPASERGAMRRIRSRSPVQVQAPEGRARQPTPTLSQTFQTPASWAGPTGKGRGVSNATKRTREVMIQDQPRRMSQKSRSKPVQSHANSLDREVEKAMFKQLAEQNELLRQQVDALKSRLDEQSNQVPQSASVQATASASVEPQPRPVMTTPPRETPMMTPMTPSAVARCTPGGTKVPSGPPPDDSPIQPPPPILPPMLPPWPASLGAYEVDNRVYGALRNDVPWQPVMSLAAKGGARSRWMRGDLFHQGRAVSIPGQGQEARVLHGASDVCHHDRALQHQDVCQQVRAVRNPEQSLQVRAVQHPEQPLQDRAVQNPDERPQDRAVQNPEECPQVRAVQNHDEPLQARAALQAGERPQGRADQTSQLQEEPQGHAAPKPTSATTYQMDSNGVAHESWDEEEEEDDPAVQQARDAYWKTPVEKGKEPPLSQNHLREGVREILKEMNERTYTEAEVQNLLLEVERRKSEERHKARKEDDGLRSFQIVLPQLPEPTIANASLEAGDWLTQVRPLINDVSSSASTWWSAVEQATAAQYQQWLSSTPLEKLKVMAPNHAALSVGHERLAQRVSVMLMQAIPSSLKQELIAPRQMDATNILFKIFRVYQPGGLAERRHTLSSLTNTTVAKTPQAAVQNLRLWKRQSQRAKELRAAMPDPILQVQALTTIMEEVLAKEPRSAFRVNAHRMTNGIDVAPSEHDIDLFYDLLMAEAEYLTASAMGDMATTDSTTASKPQVKAVTTTPSKSRETQPCKFWGHEGGCKAGRNCKYLHDWQGLDDRSERCWNCSAKGHRKVDCPTVKKEDQMQTASGGSAAPPDKSDGKGKGKKGKSKANSGGKADGKEARGVSSNETKTDSKTEDQQPSVKAEKVEVAKEETPASTTKQDALMTEVTSLLRSLRVQGQGEPQIRMVEVRSLQKPVEGGHTLLDGGATHCLRKWRTSQEWNEAIPVNVKLAAGEVQMRQHPLTSTLLTNDDVQAIVPVAKLIECGYVITWNREACRVEHGSHGRAPVEMHQGCPTVSQAWGEKLMQEVEIMEGKRAKLRAVMTCGLLAEDDYDKKAAELQSMFPDVPLRILERIPGEKNWDPVQIPYNRRRRRQIARAKAVIVNMCSGPDSKRWADLEQRGVAVINLDVILGVNVMDPHVSGWLEELVDSGKVIAWTAGPPCRTVSLCRQRGWQDGGPKPLRSRNGPERFGLNNITGSQQELADHDAALWLKNLWLMRRVKRSNDKAEVMLEQPQDPAEWHNDGASCPSFLQWPETRQFIEDFNLHEVRICQGDMGHQSEKPTTLITDMFEVTQLHKPTCSGPSKVNKWPTQLQDRMSFSKSLASWAPGLVAVIKMAMKRLLQQAGEEAPNSGAGGSYSTASQHQLPEVKALNQKERAAIDSWKAHVDMNHYPYRRDCAICVETMGRDRPRRRLKSPEPFTLALDVAGPFVPGKDQIELQPRYFVIATMTIPMWGDKPMVESLRKLAEDEQELDIPGPPIGDDDQPWEEFVRQCEAENSKAPEKASEDAENKAADVPAAEPSSEPPDPFQIVGREDKEEPLSEAQVKELDASNQRWKEYLAGNVERPVKTLTMAIPTKSKKAQDVIKATAQAVARLRSLHIPINRVHTDRGKEFIGRTFRQWLQQRDYFHTTTAGDEPASNARAENEIKILKGRARVLMRSAQCEPRMWPSALRYASEERFRRQLQSCGVPTPALLPFGIRALAKQKSWQHRYEAWRNPMIPVRVWGPAWDMSMTSKGYFLEVLETGKMMRSTVAIVPKGAPAICDEAPKQAPVESPQQPAALEPQQAEDLPADVASVSYAPSVLDEDNVDDGVKDLAADEPVIPALLDEGAEDGVLVDRNELELELERPPPGDRGIPVHDPPRRRMTGKQPPRPHEGLHQPTLRKLGGEWNTGENSELITGESNQLQKFWVEQQAAKEEALQVLEHSGLDKWAREERLIANKDTFNTLAMAETTIEELEKQLIAKANIKKL